MSPGRVTQLRTRPDWRRKRVLGWLITALAMALVVLTVWLIWFSPVFAVRELAVKNTRALSANEVTRAANIPLGEPMARLDYTALTERVKSLPEVKEVRFTPRLPRGLDIVVTEREPVYIAVSRGKKWLVDRDGRAFREATVERMVVAEVSDESRELLADVARVVTSLPPPLKDGTLKAKSRHSIDIALTSGKTVRWGDAEDSALKADVAQKLMAAVDAREYDVSSPTRPVTR